MPAARQQPGCHPLRIGRRRVPVRVGRAADPSTLTDAGLLSLSGSGHRGRPVSPIASTTVRAVTQAPEQPDLERGDCNCRYNDDYDRQEHFGSLLATGVHSARIGGVAFAFGSCTVVGEPRLADYRGGPPSESPVSHYRYLTRAH